MSISQCCENYRLKATLAVVLDIKDTKEGEQELVSLQIHIDSFRRISKSDFGRPVRRLLQKSWKVKAAWKETVLVQMEERWEIKEENICHAESLNMTFERKEDI